MNLIKKTITLVTSILVGFSACVMPISAETLTENSEIFNGWKVLEDKTSLADADAFKLDDNDYLIVINNPGGVNNDGTDRWDLQFSYRGFSLSANSTYHISFNIIPSNNGKFYTKLGSINGDVEVWRNGNHSSEDFASYWDCIKVGAGQTYTMDCTFTPTQDVELADWSFHIGGQGPNTPDGCFPAGTSIRISNLLIKDITTGEILTNGELIVGNIIGDCNDNGIVNVSDMLILKKYILGISDSSKIDLINADYNKDDNVNVIDLLYLQRYLLNEIKNY